MDWVPPIRRLRVLSVAFPGARLAGHDRLRVRAASFLVARLPHPLRRCLVVWLLWIAERPIAPSGGCSSFPCLSVSCCWCCCLPVPFPRAAVSSPSLLLLLVSARSRFALVHFALRSLAHHACPFARLLARGFRVGLRPVLLSPFARGLRAACCCAPRHPRAPAVLLSLSSSGASCARPMGVPCVCLRSLY